MKRSFKIILPAAIIIITLCLATFISCNKDNNTQSTTIVKCVTCANGGLCIKDTCRCLAGYEGVSCETPSRDKFIGGWNVFEKGSLTPANEYSIDIEESNFTSNITSVEISDFNNNYSFSPVTGYVSGDSLYIPLQHVAGYIIIGAGYIHTDPVLGLNGAITMRYKVTDSTTGSVNDFGYNSPADSSSWTKD